MGRYPANKLMVRGPLGEGELSPPLALRSCERALHSVLAAVSSGFPHLRDRLPTCSSPSATLTGRYCYLPDPVRLACLIHAASVRSEPESNSQKKTVESCFAPLAGRGHHTNFHLCSASLPTAPGGSLWQVRRSSAPSILKDQVASTGLPLVGGERMSSISNPAAPRKGVFEKK